MGTDLRKYMPRISTILRETDPRKMEERYQQALQDPDLQAAVSEMEQTPPAPGPWASVIDEAALSSAPPPTTTAAADKERPVTKPAPRKADPEPAQRRRKVLVSVGAVLAVAVPTTLGVVLTSWHARKIPGPAVGVTVPASVPAAAVAVPASVVPGATATASASADAVPSTTAAPSGHAASPGPARPVKPQSNPRGAGEDLPAERPPSPGTTEPAPPPVPTPSAPPLAVPAAPKAPASAAPAAPPPSPPQTEIRF